MWIDAEKVREVLSVENLICLAFLLGISVYDMYSRRISRGMLYRSLASWIVIPSPLPMIRLQKI